MTTTAAAVGDPRRSALVEAQHLRPGDVLHITHGARRRTVVVDHTEEASPSPAVIVVVVDVATGDVVTMQAWYGALLAVQLDTVEAVARG